MKWGGPRRYPRSPPYARPAFASVGVWKYSLSEASCSISRFSSAMRPSAVLMGMPALLKEGMSWREVRLRAMHTAPVKLPARPSRQTRARSQSRHGGEAVNAGS